MSFSVVRMKDGKPSTIKLSIWDAFKGAPNPKPRLHRVRIPDSLAAKLAPEQCRELPDGPWHPGDQELPACCGQMCYHCNEYHLQSKAAAQADANKDGNSDETPAGADEELFKFTAEEDAKILELKAANTSWRQIAEELGRDDLPKNAIRQRWQKLTEKKPAVDARKKETQPKPSKGDKQGKTEAETTKDEKKKAKAEKDRAEGLKRKQEKEAQEAKKKSATPPLPPPPPPPPTSGAADDAPNGTSEMHLWSSKYDKQKWVAAASKHFDRTGQRITPTQAQEMAEQS